MTTLTKIQKDTLEEYHSTSAISSSQLQHILKSPKHFLHHRQSESKVSRAFDFGTLVHDVVLEDAKYIPQPEFGDQRVKANKEAKAEWLETVKGKKTCPQYDYNAVQTILENIDKNPTARELVKNSIKEVSHYYKEKTTNWSFKARPDGYIIDEVLWDLKTTSKIAPGGFKYDIQNLNYDMRLMFYQDALTYFQAQVKEVLILAVENVEPFDVVVYKLSNEILDSGSSKYQWGLQSLKSCTETGSWPGISPNGVIEI